MSASGLVTAVANGSATITATADGVTGSAAVTVAIPAAVAQPGYWAGFTDQGFTVSFKVTEQGTIESLSVRIKVLPPGGGNCMGNFAASGSVPLAGSSFSASVSNPGFTDMAKTAVITSTLQGSFSSPILATGSVAKHSGSYLFTCKGSVFGGTGGSLWSDKTWEARPIIPASVDLRFTEIRTGYVHACGLTQAGKAYCWGYNDDGQLGDGTSTTRSVPTPVAGDRTFVSVGVGSDHSCGLTSSGAAYCWGDNDYGQLGTGSTTASMTPVQVAGGLSFSSLVVGGYRTCGITSAGVMYCWGWNMNGSLGNGTTTNASSPSAVSGGLAFKTASMGDHTCAITTAGAAYCWGPNSSGQLGFGATGNKSVPTAVAGGLSFASISAGVYHSCGVTTTGVGHCWGSDSREQLGNLTAGASSSPVAVSGGLSFKEIVAGYNHTCGITTSGAPYCWGWNEAGALGAGLGETEGDGRGHMSAPLPVFGGLVLASLDAGNGRTCGVTAGGIGYCWGYAHSAGLGRTSGEAEVPFAVTARY